MSKKRIIVFDDHLTKSQRWGERLNAIPEVRKAFGSPVAITRQQFNEATTDLELRRAAARGQKANASQWGDNLFDRAAIFLVDYDLLNVDSSTYVTAEVIAYLVRCYSACGIIVAVNQFGENSFDLTLRDHPESYADLNIGANQLDNPGLWSTSWKGFRPWYWPVLPDALKSLERRAKELRASLDASIGDYLRIPDTVRETLPRNALDFLSNKPDPLRTTFQQFVQCSGNGLRRKDEPFEDESIARIAAARLARWLECFLLPGQDILVDAPHLVSRFPSLLTGDSSRKTSWNKTAAFSAPNRLGIRYSVIDDSRFEVADWLSRPAWYWSKINSSSAIEELLQPWKQVRPGFVFCEDISRFLPRKASREFVAALPSPFLRRFVTDPAAAEVRAFADDLKRVAYRPSVQFAL